MKFTEKNANTNFDTAPLKSNKEVMKLSANPEHYCAIYKELTDLIGEQNARKIWQEYRGMSIQFPQRLYSKEYTRDFIAENLDTMKPREMATLLNLTERRVRQIIKELKD
ncbi:MAG: hypothetical protein K6G01_03250 [Eubacterium sp.]|nr:hypothetical protein [Eubacterium sp.]